jgi:putative transposase
MARKSKFTEAQIIAAIKDCEAGATAKDVARRLGVSYETLNRWKAKYGGMTVSEAQEKRRLEDENTKLRKLVAQFALENEVAQGGAGKKVVTSVAFSEGIEVGIS